MTPGSGAPYESPTRGPCRPSIGFSSKSYVEGGLAAPPMPDGGLQPAYLAAAATGSALALDDGSAGREVELSSEVVAKALLLVDARGAYSFVKNETKLAPQSASEDAPPPATASKRMTHV